LTMNGSFIPLSSEMLATDLVNTLVGE
jgi:hypothetical protein